MLKLKASRNGAAAALALECLGHGQLRSLAATGSVAVLHQNYQRKSQNDSMSEAL